MWDLLLVHQKKRKQHGRNPKANIQRLTHFSWEGIKKNTSASPVFLFFFIPPIILFLNSDTKLLNTSVLLVAHHR